jgi:hypothetical protein
MNARQAHSSYITLLKAGEKLMEHQRHEAIATACRTHTADLRKEHGHRVVRVCALQG